MKQYLSVLPALLVFAFTPACGRIATDEADSGAPSSTGVGSASENHEYALRFSGATPAGTYIGMFVNLAFTIDRSQPVRDFFAPDPNDARLPGLIKSYDLMDCGGGGTSALERTVKSLLRGELAEVESLEIEAVIDPPEQEGAGVCFGYRTAAGSWTWKRTLVPFIYESATDRWRAHLAGPHEPTDAIKLAFGGRAPTRRLTRVTYKAHAPSR